jgi:hypothetical protein
MTREEYKEWRDCAHRNHEKVFGEFTGASTDDKLTMLWNLLYAIVFTSSDGERKWFQVIDLMADLYCEEEEEEEEEDV